MSPVRPAATARATTRTAAAGTSAPRLAAVPKLAARPARAPFVLLVVGILGTGLVGLLLLNTALAQGSFRLHDLQRRTAALQDQAQQLQIEVDGAGTPGHLAKAARALGLVPAQDPGFLRLTDGRVLGDPQPATAPPPPVVSTPQPTPSASAAGSPAPGATTGTAQPTPAPQPSAGTTATGGAPHRNRTTPQPTPTTGGHG